MNSFLLYQQEDGIAILTLNQPERRNPLAGRHPGDARKSA